MDGMFDTLCTVAFTLVEEGYNPQVTEPIKMIGGWVFAEPAAAEKARKYLSENAPATEVREVALPGPLEQVAERHPTRAGLWVLKEEARILPDVIRDAAARPVKKPKVKKPVSATPTAPDPDTVVAPSDAGDATAHAPASTSPQDSSEAHQPAPGSSPARA